MWVSFTWEFGLFDDRLDRCESEVEQNASDCGVSPSPTLASAKVKRFQAGHCLRGLTICLPLIIFAPSQLRKSNSKPWMWHGV